MLAFWANLIVRLNSTKIKFDALWKPIDIAEEYNVSINLQLTLWANFIVRLKTKKLNLKCT